MKKSDEKKRCGSAAVCLKSPGFLLITAFCVIFQSCELEPEQTGDLIEPQILNYEWFQIYGPEYVNASIGQAPVVIPDVYGYCRLENAPLPYDLEVSTFSYNYSEYQVPFVYKKLKIRNPKINLPYYFLGGKYNMCFVPVQFPAIQQNKIGYVKFISKEHFKQLDTFYFTNSNISSKIVAIGLPLEKQSITGKLIYMQCNGSAYFTQIRVTSFENFGIKDANIHIGMNDTILFKPQDVEFNPPEAEVNFTISYPEVPWYNYSEIYLSFPGYNTNSDLIIREDWYYDQLYQTVPAFVNIPYQIKTTSYYGIERQLFHLFFSENLRTVLMQPGTSNHITHESLNLLTPQDNEQDINENSFFTVQDDSKKGAYLFYIYAGEPYYQIHVFTDRNSIRWGELHHRNFISEPNRGYFWCAAKISEFNSIDEFAEEPFLFQENFNTIQISDYRYFTTAP